VSRGSERSLGADRGARSPIAELRAAASPSAGERSASFDDTGDRANRNKADAAVTTASEENKIRDALMLLT
jgi:hypothetical protein